MLNNLFSTFIEQLNKNPKGIATLGLVGVIAFGMMGWIFPMYLALFIGGIGYLRWKVFPVECKTKNPPVAKKSGLVRKDAPEILANGSYEYKRTSSFTSKVQAEQFKNKEAHSFLIVCDNPKRFGQGVKYHVYRRIEK